MFGDPKVALGDSKFSNGGDVSFSNSIFSNNGDVIFHRFNFLNDGEVTFFGSEFLNKENVTIHSEFSNRGDVSFRHSEFSNGGAVWFSNSKFSNKGRVSFKYSEFLNGRIVSFWDSKFSNEGDILFSGSEISNEGRVKFSDSEFLNGGNVSFWDSKFSNEGEVIFSESVFSNEGVVKFSDFHERTSFVEADLSDCEFRYFQPVPGMNFSKTDFTGSDLPDIDFSGTNLRQSVFSRCDLYGAEFTDAKIADALFGDAQVNHRTDFGHLDENGDMKEDFRVAYDREPIPDSMPSRLKHAVRHYLPMKPVWGRDSIVTKQEENGDEKDGRTSGDTDDKYSGGRTEDGGTESVKTYGGEEEDNRTREEQMREAGGTYQAIEQIAHENSMPALQSKAFIRRQEMNRLRYAEEASRSDSLALGTWGKWLRASAARLTLLYGESPWRIIGGSVLIISLFSLLYPVGGWLKPDGGEPITYSRILEDPSLLGESVYYSTLTFSTLGMGDYTPVGAGQYLTAINTGAGAVLVALLVFVLGRRAAR